MTTTLELPQALRGLSAAELEGIAAWIWWQVEELRYQTFHLRETAGIPVRRRPLFMTWNEYLTFEEQSTYRHEYINGSVFALTCESLAHNRIAQALISQLRPHLRGSPYEPYFLQTKLEIRAGGAEIMYYPRGGDLPPNSRPARASDPQPQACRGNSVEIHLPHR